MHSLTLLAIWFPYKLCIDVYYCLPTKFREGNVFTDVCLSIHRLGVPMWPLTMVCTSNCKALLAPIQTWDMGHGDSPAPTLPCLHGIYGGHHWRPIQTCSLDLTVQEKYCPHQYWHLVTTKVFTVGKQVVYILLEWFLFLKYFHKIYRIVRDKQKDRKIVRTTNAQLIKIRFNRTCLSY